MISRVINLYVQFDVNGSCFIIEQLNQKSVCIIVC